jgi:hypothetical protein
LLPSFLPYPGMPYWLVPLMGLITPDVSATLKYLRQPPLDLGSAMVTYLPLV